jgi:hypothetical protein
MKTWVLLLTITLSLTGCKAGNKIIDSISNTMNFNKNLPTTEETFCDGFVFVERIIDSDGNIIEENRTEQSAFCGWEDPAEAGTILNEYCEGYSFIREIADGNFGKTVETEENSSECGYNPPAAGSLLKDYCEGFTLIKELADGNYGKTIEQEENSPECGWAPPPSGTILDQYCDGFDLVEDVADGNGGTIVKIVEKNSFECGSEPEILDVQFEGMLTTFKKLDVIVNYTQNGEVLNKPVTVSTTIGVLDETSGTTPFRTKLGIEPFGQGTGTVTVNDKTYTVVAEADPICVVSGGFDCRGYRATGINQIYYPDDQVVDIKLYFVVAEYRAGFYRDIDATQGVERDMNVMIEKVNNIYKNSGVHINFVYAGFEFKPDEENGFTYIKRVMNAPRFDAIQPDIFISMGNGSTQYCGLGKVRYYFTAPGALIVYCWNPFTLSHEIGHTLGLAHGPNNSSNAANGYIYPDFGHGIMNLREIGPCNPKEGSVMSYSPQRKIFSNSLIETTCEQGLSYMGDRTISDAAASLNFIRFNASLAGEQYYGRTGSNSIPLVSQYPLHGAIIVD